MIDDKGFLKELMNRERKALKIHAIYLAILFVLLSIFLILIAPNTVNPRAFENFSFASTIVSIVLAVVSIVYSFKSKSDSSDNMAGIRAIEQSIDSKLHKFDTLKTEIVEEVREMTRPIEAEVSNIRLGQVETSNQMKQVIDSVSRKTLNESEADSTSGRRLFNGSSFYGNVLMYLLNKSFKSKKKIDFDKLGLDFKENFDYFFGFWIALTSIEGRPFDYEGNKSVITVTKFDEDKLGDASFWRMQVEQYKSKEDVRIYLETVDKYIDAEESGHD